MRIHNSSSATPADWIQNAADSEYQLGLSYMSKTISFDRHTHVFYYYPDSYHSFIG
jgi:hypothetical protein